MKNYYWTFGLIVLGMFSSFFPLGTGSITGREIPILIQKDPALLCEEGVRLYNNRQFIEALPLLEAGFSERKNARFNQPSKLANCAYYLGLLKINDGELDAALEALKVALDASQNSAEIEFEADILTKICDVLNSKGLYEEARMTCQQSLQISQKLGYQFGEANTLNVIGVIHRHQGRYKEALDVYDQAIEIWRQNDLHIGEAISLNGKGAVYYSMGNFTEALNYYKDSLKIKQKWGTRASVGTTLNNIGDAYRSQGRYKEALDYLNQALLIHSEEGPRIMLGTVLNNIGLTYYYQNRPDPALENFLRALEIRDEVGDRSGKADTLNNLGLIYLGRGQYREAYDQFDKALEIARSIGNRSLESISLLNIGYILLQEDNEEAEKYYLDALRITKEIGDRVGEGITLNHLGLLYYSKGRFEKALEFHSKALDIALEVSNLEIQAVAAYNIGKVYRQQNQIEKALEYFSEAMDRLEEVRSNAGSESGRASFIAQYSNLYLDVVKLLHEQKNDEEAFTVSERGRGRAFLDSLATGYVELEDQTDFELFSREREAYENRQSALFALSRAKSIIPTDEELVKEMGAQVEAADQKYAGIIAEIDGRDNHVLSVIPGRKSIQNLNDVQSNLDNGITLISYFSIGDEGSLAFVINQDSFTTIELPQATATNIDNALEELQSWASVDDSHPQTLQDLYEWLVAPVLPFIKTDQVGIIPHQHMHYIPFAALSDGSSYFGENFILFELPSASSLSFIQQNAREVNTSHAMVFGNPTIAVTNLSSLVFAETEARKVAEILGTQSYTGVEASEDRLRVGVKGAGVVHLAAHGAYDPTNPMLSTLFLASKGNEDGRLEVQEIYGLDLSDADLVTLSACQTHLGELSRGDEVVGLTRAFLFAGTSSVLASLWNVNDEATQLLMEAFYQHWRIDGLSKAAALRAAQAEVRAKPGWQSPYYWAGFVLNGDPGKGLHSLTTATAVPTETALVTPTQTERASGLSTLCGSSGMAFILIFVLVFSQSYRKALKF